METSRRNFLLAGLALPAALDTVDFGPMSPQNKEPVKLTYRSLGKTGLKPTSVGFGCMITSDQSVVEKAADLGINYFDTARGYQNGNNERMVGAALKSKRKDLIISTKTMSRTKEEALQHIDMSLKELGTDYVDIWHLHARDTPASVPDEAVEAMEICKKSGKARFIGFSCHDPNRMADFVIKTGKFDVIQTTYSFPIGGIYRDQAIKKLHDAGVGIIAMKVVVALTGLNLKKLDNPPATKGDGPLAGIKWVLQNPAIGTTVPHMKTIPELEMNFRAMSEPYMPADEKLLYVMNEQIRPDYCRMCYECKGQCPKGVPVTEVLRFLAYNDFCGNYHQAVLSFRDLAREVRDVRCSDCSSCAIQCPNGVHVQDRLIRAQRLLA